MFFRQFIQHSEYGRNSNRISRFIASDIDDETFRFKAIRQDDTSAFDNGADSVK